LQEDKIKILYVITSLNLGGAENHLLQLLPKLNKDLFDIAIYPMRRGGILEKEFEDKNIKVLKPKFQLKPPFHIFVSAPELINQIKSFSPDIIHFFLPEAYVIGGMCANLLNHKNMIMSRRSMNYYQKKHKIATRLEHWLHNKMKLLLGNSSKVCEQLTEEVEKNIPIKKIYNGIDDGNLTSTKSIKKLRQNLKIKDDDLVFVIVANLIGYKGHKDLIKAFELAKEKINPNWKLLCVGKGTKEYTNKLKNMVKKASMGSNVLFLGLRDDVFDILSISDVGLLVSHEEGFSNAILEKMAASLPLIVTNVGGNAEAVMNNANGYVVNPKDIKSLSDKIVELANNNETRIKMGKISRSLFEKSFKIEKCVSEYEKTYLELIRK
jgi:glycosyltransferase involved in cell wall biosynthesis